MVCSLHLMMYQTKKQYILHAVVNLIEGRNYQNLPKIHTSPYVPVHFSCYRCIWTQPTTSAQILT